MTDSATSMMAILFGLAVFAVIVAVGWRNVQNRRILRLKDANGQETIVVAGEDDEISSVATTEVGEPAPVTADEPAAIEVVERDRLKRVVSSTR